MRIRALKPGFYSNEQLAELSPWHRLCYAGLWLCADKEGRMEDRPKRLKAAIFPYDDLDMNSLLWDLEKAGFIKRYSAENRQPLIWIPSWNSHQFPRSDEAASKLAAFTPGSERDSKTDLSSFPIVRPLETDPSLQRADPAVAQQIGNGILDLGNGTSGDRTAPAAPSPAATRPCRAQDLVDLWNATTKPPIPRCRELTDERRRKIRSRIAKRPDLSEWREAFEAVQGNAFCTGDNDRGWVADFDWIIKNDTVAAKMLERARTSRASQARGTGRASLQDAWQRAEPWLCPHTPRCPHRTACAIVAARVPVEVSP